MTAMGLLALLFATAGCDEYHESEPTPAAQQAPPPAAPGADQRKSTLGKAMDAGERTRDRVGDYQQKLLEEAENVDQP